MAEIEDLLTEEEKEFKQWLEKRIGSAYKNVSDMIMLNMAYVRAQKELKSHQKRRLHLREIEENFLLISQEYLSLIETEDAKERLKQDIYSTIKGTHAIRYPVLAERFPELLPTYSAHQEQLQKTSQQIF